MSAEGVSLERGGRAILRQAYVDAVGGTVTGLVGRIGAGKTTLLRVLVGRSRPDAGQVRWEGARQRRPRLDALACRGLAYVPDHPWLCPRLTVRAHLELAGRVAGRDWRSVAGIARSSLDHRPGELSTGERRLSELAVAAILGTRALVLDEPFRELDPIHRECFGTLLRERAVAGCAVLFADHDVASVLGFADRLFSIETGATRPVPGFRERPVAEWYLGWPA
jgi:ABC-type multidrug transport system ATPase subunit